MTGALAGDLLHYVDVANALGCTPSTLETLHRVGTLVGLRVGTDGLRYPRESLLRQLNRMADMAVPEVSATVRPGALGVITAQAAKAPPGLPSLGVSL